MHDVRSPARLFSRDAAVAVGIFVAVRVLGVLALAGWAAATSQPRKGPHTLLSLRWDSLWYSRIARNGYGYSVRTKSGDLHSDLAFFPLLPALERAGHALTGLAVNDVGLCVSIVSSVLAAAGIHAVTRLVAPANRLTPVVAVVLWAALPVGVVQWMAYSESLFTAAAVWASYAVLTRRWLLAGTLASLAGLTRPVGVAVVLAVWTGGYLALWKKPARKPARNEFVRILIGAAIAPLGMAGYVLWVAHRTQRGVAGYLDVQSGWRNGFDGGATFARFVADKFHSPVGTLAGCAILAAVAVVGWALVACVRARLPWPVLVYTFVTAALALGASGYFGSKPRFFVPIFPLLIPSAGWLAAQRDRYSARVIGGLVALTVLSTAYGVIWLNGSGPP